MLEDLLRSTIQNLPNREEAEFEWDWNQNMKNKKVMRTAKSNSDLPSQGQVKVGCQENLNIGEQLERFELYQNLCDMCQSGYYLTLAAIVGEESEGGEEQSVIDLLDKAHRLLRYKPIELDTQLLARLLADTSLDPDDFVADVQVWEHVMNEKSRDLIYTFNV